MKKNYVIPSIETISLEIEDSILNDSPLTGLDNFGHTDSGDSLSDF